MVIVDWVARYPEVTSTTTTGLEVTPPSDQLADARAAPVNEAALVEHYGLDADARELLGFGDDDDEDDDDEGDEEAETFDAFQTRVRLDAVKRTEGNRREGGLKTQQASVRLWNVCITSSALDRLFTYLQSGMGCTSQGPRNDTRRDSR